MTDLKLLHSNLEKQLTRAQADYDQTLTYLSQASGSDDMRRHLDTLRGQSSDIRALDELVHTVHFRMSKEAEAEKARANAS